MDEDSELDARVDVWNPKTKVVLRGENDSATSTDTITVTPQDGGSEITYEAVIEAKGVGKLAEPLMKLVFERIGSETEKKMTEVLDRLAG